MKASLARLLQLASPHRRALIVAAILSVAATLLGMAAYLLAARIVAALLQGQPDRHEILILGLAIMAALGFRFAARGAVSMLGHRVAYAILFALRLRLAGHLLTLSLGTLAALGSGRLKKLMADDVEAIELFFAHHLEELAAALIAPPVILLVMAWIDPGAALAAALGVALVGAAMAATHRDYRTQLEGYHDAREELNGRIAEYVRGLPVMRSFAASAAHARRFGEALARYAAYVKSWSGLWFLPNGIFVTALAAPLILTILVVGWSLEEQGLGLANALLLLMLAAALSAPLQRLSTLPDALLRLCEGERRVNALLLLAPLPSPEVAKRPVSFAVQFEKVRFGYGERPALDGVSFNAQEGSLTVLAGPSGAGKSTAARLVPRFWDVSDGKILIGGIDVREIAPEGLTEIVSFMFQETVLFDDTVAGNIRIGRAGATDREVEEAARAAGCDSFIARLPQGYGTMIGAGGTQLSGGERQRIALARALLKDAPILLLDEATSALDAEVAADIHRAILQIAKRATLIVVSHKPTLMALADQVVFLEDGRVSGCGTHRQLLARLPAYRAFLRVVCEVESGRVGAPREDAVPA